MVVHAFLCGVGADLCGVGADIYSGWCAAVQAQGKSKSLNQCHLAIGSAERR